jgi:hypothetical protein
MKTFDCCRGNIAKSTLVSMLNASTDLSKDRLKRAQVRGDTVDTNSCQSTETVDIRTSVGLFSDVTVLIKDPGRQHASNWEAFRGFGILVTEA